jgi:hypothetical protein
VKSGDEKNDEKNDENNNDEKNEVRKIWGWKMFHDVSM